MSGRRWVLLASVLLVSAACSSMAMAPPSVDVTGNWAGDWRFEGFSGGGQIQMALKQSGSDVAGSMTVTGAQRNPTGPVEGTVSGNEFSIRRPAGMPGSLTVSGDQMSGIIQGLAPAQVTLRRVK
jgi:hypothetical protein